MNKEQKLIWEKFKAEFNPARFKKTELKPMFTLHAELFNHKYHEPCTCNGSEIKSWINNLDKKYAE